MSVFDPQLNPSAWFDELLVPEGWFDSDLIPVGGMMRALVAAFVVVEPDYAHPQHGHHDRIAIATTDFLALALVVVAAFRRFRSRRSSAPDQATGSGRTSAARRSE